MTFLTANWKNLIMANYIVSPDALEAYLPKGTELDLWNGSCYISLVGFLFKDTKVLGLKIPKHTDFEEVNLRFYVKRYENGNWKRGVVFVKEIVPKHAITFIANTLYKEHYETHTMAHQLESKAEVVTVGYQWQTGNQTQTLQVKAYDFMTEIDPESEAEFIMEHYFGYTKFNETTTYEYEVQHPKWKHYFIKNYTIDIDFTKVYGNSFSFLNDLQPTSVFLAEGSEIRIKNKRKITL